MLLKDLNLMEILKNNVVKDVLIINISLYNMEENAIVKTIYQVQLNMEHLITNINGLKSQEH